MCILVFYVLLVVCYRNSWRCTIGLVWRMIRLENAECIVGYMTMENERNIGI